METEKFSDRTICTRIIVWTGVFVVFLFALNSISRGETPANKPRKYSQGLLKISEFRQDAEGVIPGKALTMTRVMYEYRTFARQLGPKEFEVELRSLNAYSVFLPEESWWSQYASPDLLDHEQGHFDIAEIAARRIELTFRKALKSERSIRGVGRTVKLANRALEMKLAKVFEIANEQSVEENRQYDLQTTHGLRMGKQVEYRRIQKLTLRKLGRQLGIKEKAAAKDTTAD